MVEMIGFEPTTSCVQGRRSPTELHPKRLRSFLSNQISHPFINQTSFPIKTSFISKKRLFDKKHTMILFKKETGTENHSAHLFFMTDKTHKDGIAAL